MGRCELLRAVKFMQEEPGGVGVHLHQVEENPVERWTGVRWGARGGGEDAGVLPRRLFEEKTDSNTKSLNGRTNPL